VQRLDRCLYLALLSGGLLVMGTACSAPLASGALTPQPSPATGALGRTASGSQETSPAINVYDENGAKVVNITSLAIVRTANGGTATRPQGNGSGFMYDVDGRIVTNNHVVEDAAQLQVTFKDRTSLAAKMVGRDPDNDLAVIQVSLTGNSEPVTLGDSDRLRIGQAALAIGSPLGLQQTMTAGIVSALRPPGEDSFSSPLDLLGGVVQTDASINPGNSGGPLFDAAGDVIGVNTAIVSQGGGNEGIGFAIPINVVKRVVPELIQTGRYRHPQLGIAGVALEALGAQARQQLGIPATQTDGVLVLQVSDGAQQAGILAGGGGVQLGTEQIPTGGDIVIAIDGRPVSTTGELRASVENTKHPGDTVTLSVVRNGQHMDVPVILGERPSS
jgi:S1-C subfamily serine protease